jgi:hypothetical protein
MGHHPGNREQGCPLRPYTAKPPLTDGAVTRVPLERLARSMRLMAFI